MTEVMEKEKIVIENMIYEIRGKQVMLDSDLAKLYECKGGTKDVNRSVKNNIDKFPERFSWVLTNDEVSNLRLKFLTANISAKSRSNPRVFTEQGVAMLATILKSKVATEVSINIMDAFVSMRKYISSNLIEQRFINNLVLKDNKRIDLLEETFSKFKSSNNEIYFEGQIYDAYSKIIEILKTARKEIIIIDGYADKTILDIISKIKIKVILICKTKSLLSKTDIDKYNKQYDNLRIVYNDSYHDRYFLLDKTILYHCGASINYIGTKTFSINKIEDQRVIVQFTNDVDGIIN